MQAVKCFVATATWSLAIISILALPAAAGPLSGNPNAFVDGFAVTWSGTTPYDDGTSTLVGTVDWAVFTASGWSATGYGGIGGWTPLPGEMVYAYQLINAGTAPVSSYSVSLINPAGNIGAATITGSPGTASTGTAISSPGSGTWSFSASLAASSSGLVFNSPNTPQNFFSSLVDFGLNASANPVPSPTAIPVPEPGTGALLICGLAALLMTRARGRHAKSLSRRSHRRRGWRRT